MGALPRSKSPSGRDYLPYVQRTALIEEIEELSIDHSIISMAVLVGRERS